MGFGPVARQTFKKHPVFASFPAFATWRGSLCLWFQLPEGLVKLFLEPEKEFKYTLSIPR